MNIEMISLANQKIIRRPCVACIGHFDGVHVGHQALIQKTVTSAKEMNLRSVLITFDPDPLNILLKQETPYLTHIEERMKWIDSYGIDEVLICTFDEIFMNLSKEEFIEKVLLPLQVKKLVCGFDYRFGKKGEGDAEYLKSLPENLFTVSVVPPIEYENRKISTSYIKQLLTEGNISLANHLLGHPFSISSKVIYGKQIGRTIGFPTANLYHKSGQMLPKEGVYRGYAFVDEKKYVAMINVGKNPTFHSDYPTTVEAHLLDFDQDLYGQEICIHFLEFIRPEIKFNSAEELIRQLHQDKEYIRQQS